MAFDPRFLEELKSRISLYSVISRKVKLRRKTGHSYAGLCPFHNEKTPSFIVDENKGFYHCFGCGAHGNIFDFMVNAFHMSFPEAVEQLAGQAGLPMPVMSERQQKEVKKRKSLFEIMEEACRFYEHKLLEHDGEKAVAYLKKREISRSLASRFRLGYATVFSDMHKHLLEKGADIKDLEALGLVTKPDPTGSRKQKDYFRDRLMFPITNRQGKVIAFGGRIMTDGEPKYLNSPETELFHKSDVLYGLHQALDAVHKTGEILVCEGYVDVISLHGAGIEIAVAPLGTALTEDHLKLLWSLSDEPFLCFDGDKAGIKASYRACDRALPMLAGGKSLRFVFLPDDLDPDDFIKQRGAEAFREYLKKPVSLFDLVWSRLTSGKDFSTPERKAGLEKEIRQTAELIQDPAVRSFYFRQMKEEFWKMFSARADVGSGTAGYGQAGFPLKRKKGNGKAVLLPKDDKISLKRVPRLSPEKEEILTLLAYLVCYPQAAQKRAEDFFNLSVTDQKIDGLRQVLVQKVVETEEPEREEMLSFLSQRPEASALSAPIERLFRTPRDEWEAAGELDKMFGLIHISSLEKELKELADRLAQEPSQELLERYLALKREKEELLESSVS